MILCVFGDSIAHGYSDSEGGWVARINAHFGREAIQNPDLDYPTVYNLGVSGDTTEDLLLRIEAETAAREWEDEEIFLIIAIGTNDCARKPTELQVTENKSKKNLNAIVERMKPVTDGIIMLGVPAVDEGRTAPVDWVDATYLNTDLAIMETAIAEVAKEQEVTYVPVFPYFVQSLEETELLDDGLHPNDVGHALIAQLVLSKINVASESDFDEKEQDA